MTTLFDAHGGYRREENLLINPFFRFDQEFVSLVGTPVTAVTTSAGAYRMDQWVLYDDTTDGSRQVYRNLFTLGQTEVRGNPQHHFRWVMGAGTGGTIMGLGQRLENVRLLAGQKIGVSIWMKSSVAFTATLKSIQNFGTGGSPSTAVTTTLTTFAVTTGWKEFRFEAALPGIAGKTLGTTENNYTELRLEMPLGVAKTWDVSNASCVLGKAQSAHQIVRSEGHEIGLCQRYYEKSSALELIPNPADASAGVAYRHSSLASSVGSWVRYAANKRSVSSTVLFYNPDTGANNIKAEAGTSAGTIYTNTQFGFTYGINSAPGAEAAISFHWVANARL